MFEFTRNNLHFVRDNIRWIGGGFLLTLFSSFGQTFFIGLSGNHLRSSFHLSAGGFGAIYMVATLASAASLPWLGRTLDFMPGWKVARFTIPALAAACILMATAPNLAFLTLAIYLLRLFGQGMMTETAFTEVGRWFVANRGRAMSLITPGYQVGAGLLPTIVVIITKVSGSWRTVWFASAAALVFVGLPAIVGLIKIERVPKSHETAAKGKQTARNWTRGEVIRDPIFYLLLAGTLAPSFIGTSILFHQGYLIELRGYNALAFAATFPVMSVTTIIFGFACGHLIDQFGAIRLLPFFLIPLVIASAAVALITPVWGIYVFMLLLGISNGFTSTLLGALWPEVYGIANLGGIRAITVAGMVLASALGPGITGTLIDFGIPLPTQMFWMAGWCLVASVALAFGANKLRSRERIKAVAVSPA